MPTKRELRELEETQKLNTEEIKKAAEQADEIDAQDGDGLEVADFKHEGDVSPLVTRNIASEDEYEEKPSNTPIFIGIAIAIVFILVLGIVLINGLTKNSSDISDVGSVATPTPTVETEEKKEILDFYHLQTASTAITEQLIEDYGTDYTKPSTDQFTVSGSESNPTISFDLTVGDAYKKNYIMPAEFKLSWNSEDDTYEIISYTVDDDEAVASGWKSNSSKKDAKKQTEDASTEGTQVSNFEVNVNKSVTVSITGKGSGTVTAYAIAEDGTTTELASVSGSTVTTTTELDSGSYKLVLYTTDDAGYSWNYNLN